MHNFLSTILAVAFVLSASALDGDYSGFFTKVLVFVLFIAIVVYVAYLDEK